MLAGRPEGKSPLVRPRLRWEDKVTMNLSGSGMESMNWIDLAQDRDRWRVPMNTAMKALYDLVGACSTNGGEER